MRITKHWTQGVIESIRDVTTTVRELSIRAVNGILPYEAGSHLQIQVMVNGKPQTRTYSLVGLPDGQAYRIAVKRLDDGKGGSLAMWKLSAGDRVQITEPDNQFALDLTAPAYLLVAGGIGVTPLVQMAQALKKRDATVRMLFGARTQQELAYFTVLRETLGDALRTAIAESGEQIDFAKEIADLPAGGQMYVCGPVPMLDAVRRAWMAAGRALSDLRYETFGNSGRLPPQAFRVSIPRHALDITVASNAGLLDTLEASGVQALYGCRNGECGLCTLNVLALEGEIDHRDVYLTDAEKQENKRICVCVSRVVGFITLDSAYRPDTVGA
jgi:ferredoxin-NADP reductase